MDTDWQAKKTVLECNDYMLTHEISCDVSFQVGQDSTLVKAHKYVLGSRSNVFYAMFYGPMSDSTGAVIHIEDIEEDAFRVLIRYLYTEKAALNGDNVVRVLHSANKYGVTALEDLCDEFLDKSISKDNVLVILESAVCFRKENLQEKCLTFISRRSSILKSEKSLNIKKECFSLILQRNELCMSEEGVYQYAVDWAKRECGRTGIAPENDNIRKVLGTDIYHIRFPLMQNTFFTDNIALSGLLTSDECVDVLMSMVGSSAHATKFVKARRWGVMHQCMRFQKNICMDSVYWGETISAIRFSVDQAILLAGIVLYDLFPGKQSQSIDIEVSIKDSRGTCILNESKQNANNDSNKDVSTHTYRYLLQHPIEVKPDSLLEVIVKTNIGKICYGENGQENVVVEGVKFVFKNSTKGNSTTTGRGQIPGLLFR